MTVANTELCACIDDRCGSNSKMSVILWIGLFDIGFSVMEMSQATCMVKWEKENSNYCKLLLKSFSQWYLRREQASFLKNEFDRKILYEDVEINK